MSLASGLFLFQDCAQNFQQYVRISSSTLIVASPVDPVVAAELGTLPDPLPNFPQDPIVTIPAPKATIPFIQLNLSGAASLPANMIVLDSQGRLLDSYEKLGLGAKTETAPQIRAAVAAEVSEYILKPFSAETPQNICKFH